MKLALRAAKPCICSPPGAAEVVGILVGRELGLDEATLGHPDHFVLDGETVPEPRSAQGQTEIRVRPLDPAVQEELVFRLA